VVVPGVKRVLSWSLGAFLWGSHDDPQVGEVGCVSRGILRQQLLTGVTIGCRGSPLGVRISVRGLLTRPGLSSSTPCYHKKEAIYIGRKCDNSLIS
jgi:hypothetical protein